VRGGDFYTFRLGKVLPVRIYYSLLVIVQWALLCRQQAVLHPEQNWKWLGQAERWEHQAKLR
jgi:hypothetical protein